MFRREHDICNWYYLHQDHLPIQDHLIVKQSIIQGAGQGLFTSIPREKNTLVCEYTGKKMCVCASFVRVKRHHSMR